MGLLDYSFNKDTEIIINDIGNWMPEVASYLPMTIKTTSKCPYSTKLDPKNNLANGSKKYFSKIISVCHIILPHINSG